MDIQRIDASLVRILASTDAASTPVRFALGERVMAQVTGQLADGRLLLDVKGQTLEARSALPLSAGQSVQLEVAGLGQEIALRVLGSGAVISEQRLALGTLAAAHASTPPAPPPDVGALLRALDVEVSTLTGAQRGELTRLLGPLRTDGAPGALAAELQHVLQNGGLLFESRVRTWLEAARPAAAQSLPAELGSDLKVLLGVLGRALQSVPPGGATPFGTATALQTGDTGYAALLRRALTAAGMPPGQLTGTGPAPADTSATTGPIAGLARGVAANALQPGGPSASDTPAATATAVGRQAGTQSTGSLPPPADLQRALELEIARLPLAQRADLVRSLAGSAVPGSPAELAASLDELLRKPSGDMRPQLQPWLAEAQQQASPLLASQTLAAAARSQDVPSELKTLFALLGRALTGASDPGSPATPAMASASTGTPAADARAGAPAPAVVDGQGQPARGAGTDRALVDPLQRRAIDVVTRELDAVRHNDRPALETLRAEHSRVRDELLSRQIETAYHWVRDGTLSLQLPLVFGDQVSQAWLRFHRGEVEADREAEGRTAPGVYSFDLALEPPGIGPMRAHVAWSGPHLRVQFFVTAPPSAAVISPALPELSAALVRTGFAKVDTEVMVDASRCRLDPLTPMVPPAGGTILNLRA